MPFDYQLYLKSNDVFEEIVISICQEILGKGVTGFSSGRDGGRDAKFNGTAANYPNKEHPWSGQIVIQAKHTLNPIADCSNRKFRSDFKRDEIPRIIKLRQKNIIDYYLLFTNRKVSGGADEWFTDLINTETGINKKFFSLLGLDYVNTRIYENQDIARRFELNKDIEVFRFYEENIKDIIGALNNYMIEHPVEDNFEAESIKYSKLDEKNEKNRLSKEYFEFIKEKFYFLFDQVTEFLKDPKNRELKSMYKSVAIDLKAKIISKREEFDKFDEVFTIIHNYIMDRHKKVLNNNSRLVYLMLHYMYCNCDIGNN